MHGPLLITQMIGYLHCLHPHTTHILSAVKAGSTFSRFKTSVCMVILITNCYIFGSNKGIICVLCTLKINHKHFVSMEMAPPIVNKAINTR